MTDIWTEPWFGWALGVAIGLPVALVLLTEVIGWLTRRGHPAAKPLLLLRNLVLPVGAVLALLAVADDAAAELPWVRVVATLFGFLLILLVLSAFNVVLFGKPKAGTWRDRLPSIFIDIARLLLIVVGLAVLFSVVWGADVGGLFAALGVTSIVLGLALQGAIGAVVSGLLLLFEQPFRLGDWLETSAARGRVVEVNWRSVHIETDEGVQIVPNAMLAAATFTNLSRARGAYRATTTATFAVSDPPHVVLALLRQVAADLPVADGEASPSVTFDGKGTYRVSIPVLGPAAVDEAVALFSTWLWYAARRAGLTLDGAADDHSDDDERVRAALTDAVRALGVPNAEAEPLRSRVGIEEYALGEVIEREGQIADAIRVVLSGAVDFSLPIDGALALVSTVDAGDYIGQTALTREPSLHRATAATHVVVLRIAAPAVEDLTYRHSRLAKDIGQAIDNRREAARAVLAERAPARRLNGA